MSKEVDAFIRHYGVKGMTWGVRRGNLKDRVKGAALDSIQRRRATNRAIATNTATVEDYSRVATRRIGGHLNAGNKAIANRRVAVLNRREERIKAGNARIDDILDGLATVAISDLVISRRDKRG